MENFQRAGMMETSQFLNLYSAVLPYTKHCVHHFQVAATFYCAHLLEIVLDAHILGTIH